MKNIIVSLTMVILLITIMIPPLAIADDGPKPEVLNLSFSVDPKSDGYQIPWGSTITNDKNGEIVVTGPSGNTIFKTNDSLTEMVSTPNGLKKASHVIDVPSDSVVKSGENSENNIIQVIFDNELILQIIDYQKSNNSLLDWDPDNPWIEWSAAYIGNLDYFTAYWTVPTSPTTTDTAIYDYLFNAIQYSTVAIMQPVLEWRYNSGWIGRAWYGVYGWYTSSSPISASPGNVILGAITWNGNQWYISFMNNSTGQYTSIYNQGFYGVQGLSVFCTLEGGGGINGNEDVPGDTTFDYMSLRYGGNSVSANWASYYNIPNGLSGMNVQIYSSSKVKLHTAND